MTQNTQRQRYHKGELVMVSYTTLEPQANGRKVVKHGLQIGLVAHAQQTLNGEWRYYLDDERGGVDWSMGFRAEEIKRA